MTEKQKEKRSRKWLFLLLLLLLGLGTYGGLLLRDPENRKFAKILLGKISKALSEKYVAHPFSVEVTIKEPAGLDWDNEPVTSGIPLPEGSVKETSELYLIDKTQNKLIPCQFKTTCKWDDGSIKWVLLDFFASVKANGEIAYELTNKPSKENPPTEADQYTPLKLTDTEKNVTIDSGRLQISLSKEIGTIIEKAVIDGKTIISPENPSQAVLHLKGDKTYSTAKFKPYIFIVEEDGPIRKRVKIKGRFVNEKGKTLFGNRVKYDLRVTAWAGKPYVKVAFCFENRGNPNYKGERKHQQLSIKSLVLNFPLTENKNEEPWTFSCFSEKEPIPIEDDKLSFRQWYRYPRENKMAYGNFRVERSESKFKHIQKLYEGFYYSFSNGKKIESKIGKADGWCSIKQSKYDISIFEKAFWQNFPKGFSFEDNILSIELIPPGSVYPRNPEMASNDCFLFDGWRNKTTELLLSFTESKINKRDCIGKFENRLFAKAPTEWYRKTKGVFPLSPVNMTSEVSVVSEAMKRSDRLQMAKIHKDYADETGSYDKLGEYLFKNTFGKVTILTERERVGDMYYGMMNFGDLMWGYGYCSLYYDWVYGMLMQSIRFSDNTMLEIGDQMARHRYDIDRGVTFQRYEKGFHGDIKIRRRHYNNGYKCKPTHTWNRGLLLHWALTGDKRSYEAAHPNALSFYNILKKHKEYGVYIKEFRVAVWAIESCLAFYEFTGNKDYLIKANEIFDRTLLHMEKTHGSCGHLAEKGWNNTQFLAYAMEPLIRLSIISERRDVSDFLKRVLDWTMEKGIINGKPRKNPSSDKPEHQLYSYLLFVTNWADVETDPMGAFTASSTYGFMFADGYAHLYDVYKDEKYLKLARHIFKDTIFYFGEEGGLVYARDRSPLAYLLFGRPTSMNSKIHAFSTRYNQFYLEMENKHFPCSGNLSGVGQKDDIIKTTALIGRK